jgi:hypothetical protein
MYTTLPASIILDNLSCFPDVTNSGVLIWMYVVARLWLLGHDFRVIDFLIFFNNLVVCIVNIMSKYWWYVVANTWCTWCYIDINICPFIEKILYYVYQLIFKISKPFRQYKYFTDSIILKESFIGQFQKKNEVRAPVLPWFHFHKKW